MTADTLADLFSTLRDVVGDRVTVADAVREHHSHGESYHPPGVPDMVVYGMSTEEVSHVVRACAARRVPIVPFGAGTSIEGQVSAVRGGVCLDLSRMTRVLRVSPEDLDATVEAGVTHRQLNHHLRNTGLAFYVDPGADATLAGMAATRASGTTAVRYGTMRENVLALTVVLADGRVIHTGTRARKSAAGYDLTRLFVGSEGTLGVITQLTVRLHPRPEDIATAICQFPTMKRAVDTVIATIQLGVPVARIELLDEKQMDAIARYSSLPYAAAPTLFFEFHGSSAAAVREQAEAVGALAAEAGGAGFEWVTTAEDRERLWKARHDAYYASLALRPGSKGWATDVCVPISALADAIVAAQADAATSPLQYTMVAHAGDGNFHMVYLLDPSSEAELAEAERLSGLMVERALAAGGTCTGEHGVGLGKRSYLPLEHGEGVTVMRAIKQALDPHDLMNPGKVLL